MKNKKEKISLVLNILFYLIMIVLKAMGLINLNWFLVLTMFIWVPLVLIAGIFVLFSVLSTIVIAFKKQKEEIK